MTRALAGQAAITRRRMATDAGTQMKILWVAPPAATAVLLSFETPRGQTALDPPALAAVARMGAAPISLHRPEVQQSLQ